MDLSIVIPAHNEEANIARCLAELRGTLVENPDISYEMIVVDDASQDSTAKVVQQEAQYAPRLRVIARKGPAGFGRAVRAGVEAARCEAIVICMADCSDDPRDVVAYYRKLDEGYDCVYGSRFVNGAIVDNYPRGKLVVNRIVNKIVQWLFWCKFNDLSNAFKCYRASVIQNCGPFHASHFNITLEMSLSPLIRQYNIVQIPVNWYGRTNGLSKLKLTEMGRRYFSTIAILFFQRILIRDDLIAEKLAHHRDQRSSLRELEDRILKLETQESVAGHHLPPDSVPERQVS